MAKTVEIDDLQNASRALKIYMSDIQSNIQKMYQTAEACMDNLEHDQLSEKAAGKLQECAASLTLTLQKAEELDAKIQNKIREIESAVSDF